MEYTAFIPIWLLLLNMIIINSNNSRKRKTILITKFFNRTEREKKEMFELAKRFIEKECTLFTFDGNGFTGVIKEVTDGAVLLDRKGKTEIVNLNMVVRIKEIVKK